MYKELYGKSVDEAELKQIEYWNEIDLLKRAYEVRNDEDDFIFYEGPPTANGKPGLHHVISRGLKDAVCRYKTMQGFKVERKAGWDTHGLPVEIEVEKKLGLENKQDIEKYGIEAFNKKCRESVFEYESMWREMTERMAYLIDMDHPYVTLEDNYIESVWWILKQFFDKGLIYEGYKILPYCTRCGTGLASHEVAQGYKEIDQETVYVVFKRKDRDEYFLVWTTTPWTLASNVLLTVHPDVDYARVKQGKHIYIMAEKLVHSVMGDDVEILDTMKGRELEYVEYEPIMDFVKADKKAYFVTLGDYVTTEDGTGVVHSAPAFGEDDYNLGKKYDAPVLKPVNEEGKYTATPWEGRFVMDCDLDIVNWLKENGKLYKKQRMKHNYPHCWRCETPLLYYAHPSWYIEITKLREELIKNNNGVNWFPEHVGQKRFGNWLENIKDWAISRSRYWGTPINIWECDCSHKVSVGSKAELKELSINKIDDIELHRPYVDDVKIKCEKCDGEMKRVSYVLDVWFDSGAMPFAQNHYPFENKERQDKLFPADFICEGIDQTRGWFYSLLAISTFVRGESPYKNVLVNDMLLDKNGKKMSKSKGNTENPFELFKTFGADALRWYLNYVSPAWSPTKFDRDGLKEVISKFFNTLKNSYNFFILYSNNDGIDASTFDIKYEDRSELDKWLLSKFNRLVEEVTEDFDHYDLTKVTRKIQEFVNEDFSNWYIRRSRRRFWKEMDTDKKSVYQTTYEVLVGVAKLVAPISPFLSEEIYRNLTGKESVHLARYPKVDKSLINEELEANMDLAREIVTLGRAARESVSLKVRQPLRAVYLDSKDEERLKQFDSVIIEELNVKEIRYVSDVGEYMNYEIKPNFRVLGPVLGKNIGAFQKELKSISPNEIVSKVNSGEEIYVEVAGQRVDLTKENLDIRVNAKDDYTVSTNGKVFVILDKKLDDELIAEGFARELISKVQQLRKNAGLEVADRINLFAFGSDLFNSAANKYSDYIANEVLAVSVNLEENDGEELDLNGELVKVKVEKASL